MITDDIFIHITDRNSSSNTKWIHPNHYTAMTQCSLTQSQHCTTTSVLDLNVLTVVIKCFNVDVNSVDVDDNCVNVSKSTLCTLQFCEDSSVHQKENSLKLEGCDTTSVNLIELLYQTLNMLITQIYDKNEQKMTNLGVTHQYFQIKPPE